MPQNIARLPVVGPVPQLKTLAQQIKEADPSMQSVSDAVLEQAWKTKYGDRTPAELSAVPQDTPQPGIMDRLMSGLQNPQNMPVVKGALGGMAGGMVAGPPGAIGGAIVGGMVGDVNAQTQRGSVMHDYDPLQTLESGAQQGLFEAGGLGLMKLMKNLGGRVYASGAGIDKATFGQNFPTVRQQGLEGGRGTMPIITARGQERVYNRVAPIPGQMIAEADRVAGGPTLTMAEPLARGGRPVLNEIGRGTPGAIGGSAQPPVERAQVIDELRDIMRAHSSAPQQIPYQTQAGHFGIQTVPGRPHRYTGAEMQTKKQGLQTRAQDALKATNADKFPGQAGRTARGAAIGTQQTLEDYVKRLTGEDLATANRAVQGTAGLGQAMNPGFRSADDLMKMGVDPDIARAQASMPSNYMGPRLAADALFLGGGLGAGVVSGNPMLGGMAGSMLAATAHAASSPLGRRMIGAGGYTAGRALPNVSRSGRAMWELTDDEQMALQQAILNAQR